MRKAAALGEELAEEDNWMATRSDLLATKAKLQSAITGLEARLSWRPLVGAGVVLAAIGLMIRCLTALCMRENAASARNQADDASIAARRYVPLTVQLRPIELTPHDLCFRSGADVRRRPIPVSQSGVVSRLKVSRGIDAAI